MLPLVFQGYRALQSNPRSMRQYDLIAGWYATDRSPRIGVAEALAVAATLPAYSRILDLGCGNGVPITQALANAGHWVIGLDSSSGMLALFRANLPDTPVVCADARHLPFAPAQFDAAISWGCLFHLPRLDQSAVFESVSRALKPGAPFLFTAAEVAAGNSDAITGLMNGVTFHYYAVPSYRTMLADHGLVLVNVHDDPGVSTYYLARKSP
jgi:SAM-dependent methyltransferase